MKLKLISLLFISYSIATFGSYSQTKSLSVFVSAVGTEVGEGTRQSPYKTFAQAQDKIKNWLNTYLILDDFEETRFKIAIFVNGVLTGNQAFRWHHPYRNVELLITKDSGAQSAVIDGRTHECFDEPCVVDVNNTKQYLRDCDDGGCTIRELTFFSTFKGTNVNSYNPKNVFGKIEIRGLTITNYWSAINHTGIQIGQVEPIEYSKRLTVTNNKFNEIGQHVKYSEGSTDNWSYAYGAIVLRKLPNSKITNNRFFSMKNLKVGKTTHIHGVYLENNCDYTIIKNNYFDEISGTPIKIRNGTDNVIIVDNIFERCRSCANGDDRREVSSVTTRVFPVQNWYELWYKSDGYYVDHPTLSLVNRELPSFNIVMSGNSYLSGFVNSPLKAPIDSNGDDTLCTQKIVSSPNDLPNSYIDHKTKVGTNIRFRIRNSLLIRAEDITDNHRCDKPLQGRRL